MFRNREDNSPIEIELADMFPDESSPGDPSNEPNEAERGERSFRFD
jgi:hypothetical protein